MVTAMSQFFAILTSVHLLLSPNVFALTQEEASTAQSTIRANAQLKYELVDSPSGCSQTILQDPKCVNTRYAWLTLPKDVNASDPLLALFENANASAEQIEQYDFVSFFTTDCDVSKYSSIYEDLVYFNGYEIDDVKDSKINSTLIDFAVDYVSEEFKNDTCKYEFMREGASNGARSSSITVNIFVATAALVVLTLFYL